MRKSYIFTRSVTLYKKIYVEAETLDEAYDIAECASEKDWEIYDTDETYITLKSTDKV